MGMAEIVFRHHFDGSPVAIDETLAAVSLGVVLVESQATSGATSDVVAPDVMSSVDLLRHDQVGSGRLRTRPGLVDGLDGEPVVAGRQRHRQLLGRTRLDCRRRRREDGAR